MTHSIKNLQVIPDVNILYYIWQENLFSQKWRRFANFEAGCKKSPQTKFRQKTFFFVFQTRPNFFLPQFVEIIWHGVTFCCCLVFCSNYADYGLFVFLASWNWISRSAGKVLVCLWTWVWCFFVDFFRNIFFTEMWFQFFFFRNTKFNFILKQKRLRFGRSAAATSSLAGFERNQLLKSKFLKPFLSHLVRHCSWNAPSVCTCLFSLSLSLSHSLTLALTYS